MPSVCTVKERRKGRGLKKTWSQSRLMANKGKRMVCLEKAGEGMCGWLPICQLSLVNFSAQLRVKVRETDLAAGKLGVTLK